MVNVEEMTLGGSFSSGLNMCCVCGVCAVCVCVCVCVCVSGE